MERSKQTLREMEIARYIYIYIERERDANFEREGDSKRARGVENKILQLIAFLLSHPSVTNVWKLRPSNLDLFTKKTFRKHFQTK